jgi:hypothetical protein
MTAKADEQKTRRALSGSNSGMTYSRQAEIDQGLENQGRFGADASVNGREAGVHYPRMPEGSPWAGDPTGVEPSLGFSVEDQLPCGTPAEIAASELASPLALVEVPLPLPLSETSDAIHHQVGISIEALKVEDLKTVLEKLLVRIATPLASHETKLAGVVSGGEPELGTSESAEGSTSFPWRGSPPTNPPPSTSPGLNRRKGL